MNRRCGSCTLCCRVLPIDELHKPAGTRCAHQFSGGCRIYRRRGFPRSCAFWSCRWLTDKKTEHLRRPDRTGYVIDAMPDIVQLRHDETGAIEEIMVVQVWVDPARREAWRDPALWRFIESLDGYAMLVRFNSAETLAVFPPAMAADGEWHVVEGTTIKPSRTGSMLLDRLTEETAG